MTSRRSLVLAFMLIGAGLLAFASQAYSCPSGKVCPPGKQCPPVKNCVQSGNKPQENNYGSNAEAERKASEKRAREKLEEGNVQLNDQGIKSGSSPNLSDQINLLGGLIDADPPEDPCPMGKIALNTISDYRQRAAAWRASAAKSREAARQDRRRAAEWRKLAESARAAGSADDAKDREKKAKNSEASAERAEISAKGDESRAREMDRRADEEERRERESIAYCKKKKYEPYVYQPQPPVTPPDIWKDKYVCGPDITRNVFAVLHKMRADYRKASTYKKVKLCSDLLHPTTALGAWDIAQLAPGTAPVSEKFFEKNIAPKNSSYDYGKYLADNTFWFEGVSDKCAIPRHYPCGNSVVFLGQCIDPQVVNYIQWGFINNLCDQRKTAAVAHGARELLGSSVTYTSQRVLAAIGDAYASSLPIIGNIGKEMTNTDEALMRNKMAELMADPDYKDFGYRRQDICKMVCKLTKDQQKGLSDRTFRYMWGAAR